MSTPSLDASPDSNSSVPDDIFKEFTSVFQRSSPRKLPIHREFDCTIDLVPNAAAPITINYGLCMDYRGLNKNTIKDRNPIPLISEMLRTLSIGKVFTTLDLRGAYNLCELKRVTNPKLRSSRNRAV
ncbi:hypothetical protein BASA81_008166 [Batrachochytrium salamandrivorans]|nr:hypothetical protein BASA81_008166 [Batrachochytrium salamandrivorans]